MALVISTIQIIIQIFTKNKDNEHLRIFEFFFFALRFYIMFGVLNELHLYFISMKLIEWLGFSIRFTNIFSNIVKITIFLIKIF